MKSEDMFARERDVQKEREREEGQIRSLQFTQLDNAPSVPQGSSSIDLLKDVPMTVAAELGRTKMLVKEILRLGVGSVIELSRMTGEPIDVLVNGKVIARGEVVAIDENFGVRITEVLHR